MSSVTDALAAVEWIIQELRVDTTLKARGPMRNEAAFRLKKIEPALPVLRAALESPDANAEVRLHRAVHALAGDVYLLASEGRSFDVAELVKRFHRVRDDGEMPPLEPCPALEPPDAELVSTASIIVAHGIVGLHSGSINAIAHYVLRAAGRGGDDG